MWLLLVEMGLALSIIVFIMWWTLKDADPKAPMQPPLPLPVPSLESPQAPESAKLPD
jgi:hypothetical protein